MGSVYRARDHQLSRDVAIKVLTDEGPGDIERVLNEARAASALNHPNICTVYEVATNGPRHMIVMEFVDGVLLSDTVKQGGLNVDCVIRYGAEIADALAHAHQRDIIHRDLKPANLAVNSLDRVKILDFGVASRLSAADLSELTQAATIERPAAAGTLPYLAPEVLRGEPSSRAADVWALGVTLHELVTSNRPFTGRTPFDLTDSILHGTPEPLPTSVPTKLRRLISSCLTKPVADRPSANQLRDGLSSLQRRPRAASKTKRD